MRVINSLLPQNPLLTCEIQFYTDIVISAEDVLVGISVAGIAVTALFVIAVMWNMLHADKFPAKVVREVTMSLVLSSRNTHKKSRVVTLVVPQFLFRKRR